MKASLQTLGLAGLLTVVATLMMVGPPRRVASPPAPHTLTPPPGPAMVSDGRLTLVSASMVLPDDDARFSSDLLETRCTACHSASMATMQPPMDQSKWIKVVDKMRDVYKAPIAAADVPVVATALADMQRPPADR